MDNSIVATADKEEVKSADDDEKLDATPSEQSRTMTPSPQHLLKIVAEAGDSARQLLANIRSHKRGITYSFIKILK